MVFCRSGKTHVENDPLLWGIVKNTIWEKHIIFKKILQYIKRASFFIVFRKKKQQKFDWLMLVLYIMWIFWRNFPLIPFQKIEKNGRILNFWNPNDNFQLSLPNYWSVILAIGSCNLKIWKTLWSECPLPIKKLFFLF